MENKEKCLSPVYMRIGPRVCLRVLMHSAYLSASLSIVSGNFCTPNPPTSQNGFFLMYQILARGSIGKRWYLDSFKLV